ncbi:MAG: biopolymer transporter ExbD [Flavobacteriales bacterium]|nr:biopolymer transporter ExbD [Flavobacteriales bacterium]MCB0409770.1 biopolymer transporter ExbD [Flavobacteriales bacterium]MCB9336233.1 biopolymer transporter ExbD [Flavobacteriales bacterium]
MAKREISEINAGSMADIAFLLLIFFLVTTTMDTDTGLIRKLPPPPEEEIEQIDVKQRNIFEVLVNANDQLLAEGEYIQVTELRKKAKEFIKGDKNNPEMPEFAVEEVPVFGTMEVSKQIISLQNDNGTSYEMYIKVQNELIGAYNELRNELAREKFGKTYDELVAQSESSETIENQMQAIKAIYPQRISEAEPKKIGGSN